MSPVRLFCNIKNENRSKIYSWEDQLLMKRSRVDNEPKSSKSSDDLGMEWILELKELTKRNFQLDVL